MTSSVKLAQAGPPSRRSRLDTWQKGHTVHLGILCLIGFGYFFFLALAGVGLTFGRPYNPTLGIPMMLSFLLIGVPSGLLERHFARRHRDQLQARRQAQLRTRRALEIPFERHYPAFGQPGAFETFDDYLRLQAAPALAAVCVDPSSANTARLICYLADLVTDRYPLKDVPVRLRLPEVWELPKLSQDAGGRRYDGLAPWLKIETWPELLVELACQPLGEDLEVVRFSLSQR